MRDVNNYARKLLLGLGVTAAFLVLVTDIKLSGRTVVSEHSGFISILSLSIWFSIMALAILKIAGHFSKQEHQLRPTSTDNANPRIPQISAHATTLNGNRLLIILAGIVGFLPFLGILSTGPLTYGDWGYYAISRMSGAFFPFPPLWTSFNLGTDNTAGLTQYPYLQLTGALARLHINYSISERLIYFIPSILLVLIGVYLLARRIDQSRSTASVAAMLAVTSTYYISLIAGGWETQALATSLFPIQIYCLLETRKKRFFFANNLLVVVIIMAVWLSPPIAYLEIISLFAIFLFTMKTTGNLFSSIILKRAIVVLLLDVTVVVIANIFWIVPAITSVAPILPSSYLNLSNLNLFSFQSLIQGLSAFQPAWPRLVSFTMKPTGMLPLVLPLLVLLGLSRRSKQHELEIGVFAVLYAAAAALSTGTSGPFSWLNSMIFVHVPGASMFRDPVLYLSIVTILGGLLAGHGLSNSIEIMKKRLAPAFRIRSAIPVVSGLAIVGLTLTMSWPAIGGQIHQNLRSTKFPKALLAGLAYLDSTKPGNVLWAPGYPQLYDSRFDVRHNSVTIQVLNSDYYRMTGVLLSGYNSDFGWLRNPGVADILLRKFQIRYVALSLARADFNHYSEPYAQSISTIESVMQKYPITFENSAVRVWEIGSDHLLTVGVVQPASQVQLKLRKVYALDWSLRSFLPARTTVGSENLTVNGRQLYLHASKPVELTSFLPTSVQLSTHPTLKLSIPVNASNSVAYTLAVYCTSPNSVYFQTGKLDVKSSYIHATVFSWCPSSSKKFYNRSFITLTVQSASQPYSKFQIALGGATLSVFQSRNAISQSFFTGSPRHNGVTCYVSSSRINIGIIRVHVSGGSDCSHTELLLATTYSPAWTASFGSLLVHSRLSNEWENGFMSPMSFRGGTVLIKYSRQTLVDYTLFIDDVIMILLLVSLSWLVIMGLRREATHDRNS